MEQDNRELVPYGPKNSTPRNGETSDTRSTERLFARLSVGSHSRGRGHSGSPSNCSAYSEGESGFEEDEEEPAEPFFDKQFRLALKGGVSLAGEVADALKGCELVTDTSSNVHRLWRDATALRDYESSATRIVGVIGDSGEGKSSLINSLLDQPQLARTSDGGSACTSIVTEYRHRTNRHTEPYTVEIEYKNDDEIYQELWELLWSYRQLYIEGTEEQASDAEYKRYQSQSERAWHTLAALFGHRKELTPEYLQDNSEGAVDRIFKQLNTWASEFDWPGDGKGVWISTASTAKECSKNTSIFTKDSLWPFTKVIRIYLDAKVLNTGVVLADLPGFHDTNLARVKAAQAYLHRCDEIFVVARIARVITNSGLKSNLQTILKDQIGNGWESYAKQACNIAIICTNAEIINVETAKDDFCGRNGIDPAEMQALDDEIQDAENEDDGPRCKQAKQKQKYMLIGARNAHVTKCLRQAYSDLVSTGALRVFCVGNNDYRKFKSSRKRGNFTPIDATGVPDLRRFCRSIPAKAQFEAGLQFLETQLPALLHSIELWVSTGPEVDAVAQPEDVADKSEYLEQAGMSIEGTKEEAKAQLLAVIGRAINQRCVEWNKAALNASYDWDHWHWTQYNAWCRNNGTHTSPKRSFRRWNMEITAMATREIEPRWQDLVQEFRNLFAALQRDINQVIQELVSHIPEVRRSSQPNVVFLETVKLRRRRIEYLLAQDLVEFFRKLKTIQRNSTEDHAGSYILDEMLSTYRWCAMQHGSGMFARQRNKMHNRLRKGDLFLNINDRVEEDFDDLLKEIFDRIQDDVCTTLERLGSDVALLERAREGESGRVPEFKRKVKGMLSKAKGGLAGIQRDVRETKAKFQECT